MVDTAATAYVEEVTIDKAGVALLGPRDGVRAYDRPVEPTPATEALLKAPATANAAVTITAPDVTVSGFAFRGTYTHSRPEAPVIDVREASAQILDNLFRDNGGGIRVSAGQLLVSGNVFHHRQPYNSFAPAIAAAGDIAGLEVFDNVFDDNGSTAASVEGVRGLVFEGNVLLSPGTTKYQDQVVLRRTSDARVLDNAFIGADSFAISVEGVSGLEIAGNLIAESEDGGLQFAPQAGARNRNVVVSGNDFVANGDRTFSRGAIHLLSGAFADSLRVVSNRFVDNYWSAYPVAISVDPPTETAAVNAENNWWGCNEGPVHELDPDQACDAIYASGVDADPWLVLTLDASPAELEAPGTSTLTASVVRNSAGLAAPGASMPSVLIDLEELAGVGSLSATQIEAPAGAGVATLTSAEPGEAEVRAVLDYAEATAAILFKTRPPQPVSPTVSARDSTAPVVSRARLEPRTFAVNPYGAVEKLLRKRAKMGTVFRYGLSEDATVTFSVERALPGRRVGGRCRSASGRRRHGRRCTRYRAAGRFAASSKKGANAKAFSGRIGAKSLAPGRYRAAITATDAAGNHSRPKVLAFRVVRRR